MVEHDSRIIIVGAGIFGLSTALWLAKDGYKDITIFDRIPVDEKLYNPADGCDGASADINKIFRVFYGKEKHYQDLALECREAWLKWNRDISETSPDQLPRGIEPDDKLLDICGQWFLADGPELRPFFQESLDEMDATARSSTFVKGSKQDEKRLGEVAPGYLSRYHVFDHVLGGNTNGIFDHASGVNIADKSCVYARYLCEKAGIKFVVGDPAGKIDRLIVESRGPSKRVLGIRTNDGKDHRGDLVIVAAGGWTASIIPEAAHTIETTGGTVMFVDVPKERTDLWEKYSPKNFPTWNYRSGEGETFYQGGGFPITKEGRIKFGFRGRKFTNFQDHPTQPGLRVSTPRTQYTANPINTVPAYGLRKMKEYIGQAFPDLAEIGFTDSRMCWYTDSDDNNFVIDYVPEYSDSLFICTGGSGHAFKFLPLLGRHVRNQIERKPDQFTRFWKWRVVPEGEVKNGLGEGETGPRELSRVELASRDEFSFKKVERDSNVKVGEVVSVTQVLQGLTVSS